MLPLRRGAVLRPQRCAGAPVRRDCVRRPLSTMMESPVDAESTARTRKLYQADVEKAATKHADLVQYLSNAFGTRTAHGRAPAELRPASSFQEPASVEEAWAIQQAAIAAVKRDFSLKHCGYRVTAASAAGQEVLGLSAPVVSPIFAERIYNSGVRFDPASLERESLRGVELALGWTTRAPFHAGDYYTANMVAESIGDFWALADLSAHRFAPGSKVSGLMTIADFGGFGFLVISNRFPGRWENLVNIQDVYCDLRLGEETVRKGTGARVMDNPVNAVIHGANFLAHDNALEVPTGVLMTASGLTDHFPYPQAKPGDVFRAMFRMDEEMPIGWVGFAVGRRSDASATGGTAKQ